VTDEPVQREQRGGQGPAPAILVVEAVALEQQGRAVELEPCLEHVPLAEHEPRFAPPWVHQMFNHQELPLCLGTLC
jgi:hypothetical protein